MTAERVAFIGTGVMGRPMAEHLLAAGYAVAAYNRTEAKARPLEAKGARVARSAAEAAEDAGVILTMLPDTPDVVSVLGGADGLIARAARGTLVIDMSTISPSATRDLAAQAAARGVGYVDAPVSGGQKGAEGATLSIMVGGADADVARARPIFERLGRTITHLGPVGSGQLAKACNQILVGVTIEAVAEALALGARSGLDVAALLRVLGGGLGRCGVIETRGERIAAGDYAPGFRMRLHLKDLRIALEAARDAGVPLAAAPVVAERMRAAVEGGAADLDHTALVRTLSQEGAKGS